MAAFFGDARIVAESPDGDVAFLACVSTNELLQGRCSDELEPLLIETNFDPTQ
jgi:hypothetical protein